MANDSSNESDGAAKVNSENPSDKHKGPVIDAR